MLNNYKIIEIIEEVIGDKVNNEDINPFDYGLDSLGILRLVTIIEDKFNIEIDDDDLNIDNMSSISSIIKMVNKYVI